jgi:hypothetical protein
VSFTWGPFGPLNLAIDLAVLAVGAAAVAWLVGRRPRRPLAQETALCALAAAAAGLAWIAPVAAVGGIVGLSLGARVAWTTATVTAPLCALWAARRHGALWPAALAAALLGAKLYGEVLEPGDLDVERLRIEVAGLRSPVRLVHLSDLQTDGFGALQARVREEANAFAPDVVLFTGDLINHPSLAGAAGEYLAGFTHRSGKFFVTGDVDGGYDLGGVLARGGFELLDGRARRLDLGGQSVGLVGVSIGQAFDAAFVRELARRAPAPRLLLSHRPDAVFAAADGAADVVFAGHTHGGQVCLPLLGPIVTLTRVSRRIAAGGLHRFARAQVVVSRGLGWEGHVAPRVRAFCRPHLLLAELVPARP